MTRYALLGGSFDPIHNGHLHIARGILNAGAANRVAFIPNSRHNFKRDSVVLDFTDRYSLVEACLEPNMEVWTDDSQGSGYTSDLLGSIFQRMPRAEFLWVIGSDNLPALPRWHDFAWLRQNVRFLVIPRPGFPLLDKDLRRVRRKVLRLEPSPVSSTLVRQRIAAGLSLEGLVPPAIARRVTQLYQPLLTNHATKR